MKIVEGYMPFLEYKTYYRIVGECTGNKKPLLLLHGGPGSTHNYFELFDELAEDGRAIIMYDQLGCGLSATPSRPDLWNAKTWIDELVALRKHLGLDEVHILGQSWGGMQAIQYMCDYKPEGVTSLILSSTLPSADLWEKEQRRMVTYMPLEMQKAIETAEKSGDYRNDAYRAANDEFMLRHCCADPSPDDPECLTRAKVKGTEAYITAWGPNEFTPTGTLKGWDYREKIKNISAPTLVTSGLMDLCTPLIAKLMYDSIENSKWELFEFSRHMPFVEEKDKYMKLLKNWMSENE
ncbi:MAG: proline iminopeptidase-family hydrolase [Proteocatella sp.]